MTVFLLVPNPRCYAKLRATSRKRTHPQGHQARRAAGVATFILKASTIPEIDAQGRVKGEARAGLD
jgi:hypothetical protein